MKTLLALLLTTLAPFSSLAADDGRAEIVAAIKKLGDKPNYSWSSEIKQEGSQTFRLGPTEGKTEKDGWTYTKSSFNDTPYETYSKGGKGALKRDDEWKTIEELEADDRSMWIARRLKSFKAPAVEAEEWTGKLKTLRKSEGGFWFADMTEEAAKESFMFGRRAAPAAGPADAKGTVKFWIKDGLLSKFEYSVSATYKLPTVAEGTRIIRTTTVEIKDAGTTKLILPPEVKKKLS